MPNLMILGILSLFCVALVCAGAGQKSATQRRSCVVSSQQQEHGITLGACGACNTNVLQGVNLIDTPRITISIFQGEAMESALLNVASRLVAKRLLVLVLYVFDPTTVEDPAKIATKIEQQVTASVPCDLAPIVSPDAGVTLLRLKMFPQDGGNFALAASPYDCLQRGESDYEALRNVMYKNFLPNVVVVRCVLQWNVIHCRLANSLFVV